MYRLLFLIPLFVFALFPESAAAQLVTCDGVRETLEDGSKVGTACGTCEFVSTVKNVIGYITVLASIIATITLVYVGLRLVTSGGSDQVKTEVKTALWNIVLGLFFIIAAFAIVDAVMRSLVTHESLLTWDEVDCLYAIEPSDTTVDLPKTEFAPSVISETKEKCEYDADTGGYTDCEALEQACKVDGGEAEIDAEDPSEKHVTCKKTSGYESSGGECSVPASELVRVNLMGKSVQVHKDYKDNIIAIDKEWVERGGNSYYRVSTIGGYSPRSIAGSKKCSYHSRGAAIDINASKNPHCRTDGKSSSAACKNRNILITDMNDVSPPFHSVFTKNGWKWGGNWSSSKDAMHFSPSGG